MANRYSAIDADTAEGRDRQERARANSKCTQCLHQHPFTICEEVVDDGPPVAHEPITCDCTADATVRDPLSELREIVDTHSLGDVAGVPLDVQTANAILTLHDALNDRNRAKLLSLTTERMAAVAWQTFAKYGAK
jgi:hypothetical protein